MCTKTSEGSFSLIIDESHTDVMENARKIGMKQKAGGATLWK